MIVDLPATTTAAISKKLVRLRADTGSMALSRVLTLLVVVDEDEAEEAIATANDASRQHPCRIIVVVLGNKRGAARLDGQIRIGGDAGASEVVVLRLYGTLAAHGRAVVTPLLLADSPIVAWWPTAAPKDPSNDPIGAMAQRRVTDAARCTGTPRSVLRRFAAHLRHRRQRPRLVADHVVARAPRRRARPAALRAGHGGHRRRRRRLALAASCWPAGSRCG